MGQFTNNTPAAGSYVTVGNVTLTVTSTINGRNQCFCDKNSNPTTSVYNYNKGNVNSEVLSCQVNMSSAGTWYYKWASDYGSPSSIGPFAINVVAAPGKATTPTPANNATGIGLTQQLSFVRPGTAINADVWFKAGAAAWQQLASKTTATTINPGNLTGSTTYQWRVDTYNQAGTMQTGDTWTFQTLTPPSKATGPTPADQATEVPIAQVLSFTRPSNATSVDIWFGTPGALTKVVSNTTATTYDPVIIASTTYQWRIDTINAAGTTTGDTWQFITVTPPAAVSTPTPTSGLNGVARNQDISWAAGARATSYRVYFSTVQADVASKAAGALQVPDITTTTWDTGLLGINTAYYWRVVSINEAGTTDGPVWVFTTGTPVLSDPVVKNYKKRLCALANNKFWCSDNSVPTAILGFTVNPGGSYALDTTKPCTMLEAYQKIYIINDGKYFVVDFSNTKLVSQTAFDYASNYVPERGALLTQASSGACMVLDFVDTANKAVYGFVTNGTFVNNAACSSTDSAGHQTNFTTLASNGVVTPFSGTAPNVQPYPHIYRWTPYPNRLGSTGQEYGIMPVHSSIMRMYRGRCVLAGDKTAPHQWYMSEQGNFYNWAYGSEDEQAPVAGTDTDIGKIGDIIRAVVPYSDDYCLFGCSGSLWLLRGDPAVSASLDSLSYVVGVFSDTSWCFDDAGNLYVLNANGIYTIGRGGSQPVSLTDKVVPNFMVDFPVDDAIHQVCMAYDKIRNGILITKTSDTENQNFWLDLRTGGFFPELYPATIGTTSLCYYDALVASYRMLHLGGKDGYIRVPDDGAKSDDLVSSLQPIATEMIVGPLPMSKTGSIEAIMLRMNITPAGGTDQVNYQVFTGKTAEEIVQAIEAATPKSRISGIVANALKIARPRARGTYFAIRFYSDGTAAHVWAIDNLSGDFTSLGTVGM
jgi:hypothetical protein